MTENYLSGKKRNLKLGVSGHSENSTSLQTVGGVGGAVSVTGGTGAGAAGGSVTLLSVLGSLSMLRVLCVPMACAVMQYKPTVNSAPHYGDTTRVATRLKSRFQFPVDCLPTHPWHGSFFKCVLKRTGSHPLNALSRNPMEPVLFSSPVGGERWYMVTVAEVFF